MELVTQMNKETYKVLEISYEEIEDKRYAGHYIYEITGILVD